MKINKVENPDFLNDYIFYIKVVRGYSERTVEEYYMDIRTFFRYLLMMNDEKYGESNFEDIPIKDFDITILKKLTLHDIYEFEFYLSDEKNNKKVAMARKTSALKSLFKYLVNQGIIETNPMADIETPKFSKALPKYLSLEESLRLLSSVDKENNPRDYCIVTLFLNCGIRLSELVGLNKNDVDLNERRMRVLGKGSKERMIYLNPACMEAVTDYINSRENPPEEPYALFLSKKKRRISKRRVQQIIEDSLKNAQLDGLGYSTHKLRHTAATLMYQHGHTDTMVLKEILGHSSISTTEIYTHIYDKNVKDALDNSPLANVKAKKK